MVKNEEIQIQGRYGTTIFTPSNMSALLALAFSGTWLRNETLIVEPEEGKITFAGQETEKKQGSISMFNRYSE